MIKIFLIFFFLFVCISVSYSTEISTCSILSSSGYYNLTADILNSSVAYCLNISANNVELDCQGHLLEGNGSDWSGRGIYVSRSVQEDANITLKDCRVESWGFYPVTFNNVNNIYVNNLSSSGSYVGGYSLSFQTTDNVFVNNSRLFDGLAGLFIGGSSNVSVSNLLVINNSQRGVILSVVSNSSFYNLTVVDNSDGIFFMAQISNVSISNFNISNNDNYGFNLNSLGNGLVSTIKDGYIQENGLWDIGTNGVSFYKNNCDGLNLTNVTGSGGRPIEYYHTNSVNLADKVYSQLFLCNTYKPSGFTLKNITIQGSDTLENNGLFVFGGNVSSVIDNISSNNNYVGIMFMDTDFVSLFNSTFINNTIGLKIDVNGNQNRIYRNFFNNTQNVIVSINDINFFNSSIEGNYYYKIDGSGYSDLCSDLNSNGFCDYPFQIYTDKSIDYLPKTHNLGNVFNYSVFNCQKLAEPGDYILENNISNSSATKCIEIIYENISLDCQGNYIGGQGISSTFGIHAKNDNVSLKNCNVYNWYAGTWFDNSDYVKLDNFNFYNNDYPLVLSTKYSIVNNSNFYNNSNQFWVFSMENSSISNNNVYENINSGSSIVDIMSFKNSSFFNNNVYDNAWNGVSIAGKDNKIYNN
ncbi:MAG: right-handed parallel beta-helix repeat-containing protein, partial [Nanoarchaeota archaeon]|nr:right-handed parallel beta-helix repeat-containing protein [Nanoarchaeota archaeon]